MSQHIFIYCIYAPRTIRYVKNSLLITHSQVAPFKNQNVPLWGVCPTVRTTGLNGRSGGGNEHFIFLLK